MKKALLIVDIQYDFMPGGALAVNDADQVIPIINRLQKKFELIVASQDWHPRDHGSFAANHPGTKPGERIDLFGLQQVLWPVHCVQNTRGAELVESLDRSRITRIFQKGTDPAIDSYSAFFDNGHRKSTGLGDFLKQQGVTTLYVAGVATDYCVNYSALDARTLGYETFLIDDACRGVNLKPTDSRDAVNGMKAAGVRVINASQVE